jgi:hypothetical protein
MLRRGRWRVISYYYKYTGGVVQVGREERKKEEVIPIIGEKRGEEEGE